MKKMLGIMCMLLFAHSYAQDEMATMPYVKGDLLIMIDNSDNIQDVIEELSQVGPINTELSIIKEISPNANVWHLKFNHEAISHVDMLKAMWANEHIVIAQNNHHCQDRATEPDDPGYNQQWHHDDGASDNDIDSELAWDLTTGGYTAWGDTIVVCVIEGGGTDWDHPDLIDNHWTNNYETNNGVDDDGNGYIDDINGWNPGSDNDNIANGNHGTGVSGMIGAVGDNGDDVVGANWEVKIMQVDMESGITEAKVIAAYEYPLANRKLFNSTGGDRGAFVVATNASWGIDGGDPASAPIWCAFYDTLGNHGILNCGATTNSNWNVDAVGDLPTACGSDYMISVTATNNNDVRTFSGYGATTIDLGAPGQNVYTTENGGGYGSTSGTSFASPLTAGVIALMYSADCPGLAQLSRNDPQAAADNVRTALLDGTDPVAALSGECVTGGRLNAKNSLDLILEDCAVDDVGIDGDQISEQKVYPNPTSGIVTIELSDQAGQFVLYDAIGRSVINQTISGNQELDLNELTSGTYLYKIILEDGNTISDKLIVR